ncbi:Sodium channel protein type 4 subunit alpha A [Dissostichus eleginoides]|uniref:Sodium channel protein type 4 subunit alpha A n=1 Tax=Dissostichus eleginoides TaxID=100907 RepID=A0AAD9F491_DISEL|nr:Sodium channel protein type 4 subunit alpha A [Dissostichus eleginoides]
MADWKPQISYNYNPSYHAYAYGLVYQPGPEQNHGNTASWGEAPGVTDLSNNNAGVSQAYFTSTPRTREESPPGSPEQHAMSGHGHYQGSEAAGGSDTASDSEAHTSPDSWSSGSSREGSVPQADPATWAKKEPEEEAICRSLDPERMFPALSWRSPEPSLSMGTCAPTIPKMHP